MKTKNIVIHSLTLLFFLLLMLIYWAPRLEILKENGFLGVVLFFTLILSRAGGYMALFYFDKKNVTFLHIAGILAIFFILLLLMKFDFSSNMSASFFKLFYAPISSIIIIHSVFRKRCKNPVVNFFKIVGSGLSAFGFYWFISLIVTEYARQHAHGEQGGIIYLFFSFSIPVIVVLMQIGSFVFQKEESDYSSKVPKIMVIFLLTFLININIFPWGAQVHQRISEYSLRYSNLWSRPVVRSVFS